MINLIFSFVSGLLPILAFPKFSLYPLAYVALVPLLISIKRSRSIFEASICGAVSGIVFFAGVLFWINTLSKWAGVWAVIAWITLAIFQSLFMAAFAGISKYVSSRSNKLDLILVPFIWTVIEWIRSLGPYGVTGGGLGYSQAGSLPILQLAGIAGVYGITFLVIFFNEAVAEDLVARKPRKIILAILILVVVIGFGQYRLHTFKVSGKAINVAVIQGNIPQDMKLEYKFAFDIVSSQEALSKRALLSKPDIVIWPETAVTTYLFDVEPIHSKIVNMIAGGKACFLIGTPYRENDKIYNSVAAFARNGQLVGRYDKQRLVPFGEYLPLRPITYKLLGEDPLYAKDYNSNPKPKVIDLGITKAGVAICFESTFPYLVRDQVKRGAKFILVATNDAWFFDSAALYQHIQAAQMRAVENHVYVVQAANTGISAIIDPLGRVVKRTKSEQTGVLTGRIYVH
jgi:apolipoprotein N-acyltransferase